MEGTNERSLLEEKLKNRNSTLTGKEQKLAIIENELQMEMSEELGQEPENV